MPYPTDLKYTKNDEWVRAEGGIGTAGLTHYAQEALSDIVYVELPTVGESFKQGEAFASVESVKAAAEAYLPVGGTITAVNAALADPKELDALMDAAAYEKYCEERKA
jgi:glycine cleavage system H protein